jgi:hypothetical protein
MKHLGAFCPTGIFPRWRWRPSSADALGLATPATVPYPKRLVSAARDRRSGSTPRCNHGGQRQPLPGPRSGITVQPEQSGTNATSCYVAGPVRPLPNPTRGPVHHATCNRTDHHRRYGDCAGGCGFSTSTRSSTTTTVRLPPASTAAPLEPLTVVTPSAAVPDRAHTEHLHPLAPYTDALKRAQMQAYGDTGSPAHFEEDHLIPLALGGAPRDPQNLWPEPHPSPNEKDTVDSVAYDAVCLRMCFLSRRRGLGLRRKCCTARLLRPVRRLWHRTSMVADTSSTLTLPRQSMVTTCVEHSHTSAAGASCVSDPPAATGSTVTIPDKGNRPVGAGDLLPLARTRGIVNPMPSAAKPATLRALRPNTRSRVDA